MQKWERQFHCYSLSKFPKTEIQDSTRRGLKQLKRSNSTFFRILQKKIQFTLFAILSIRLFPRGTLQSALFHLRSLQPAHKCY